MTYNNLFVTVRFSRFILQSGCPPLAALRRLADRPSISYCRLPTASFRPQAACFRLPTADCLIPTAGRLLPIADCRLPTASCRLQAACFQLPTADCRLPTGYCLPPASFQISADAPSIAACASGNPDGSTLKVPRKTGCTSSSAYFLTGSKRASPAFASPPKR